jgi:hypothetical protein
MSKNMEAAFNRVTKNGHATLLLLRIRYWTKETKYGEEFDGFKWIRNPHSEWADQIGTALKAVLPSYQNRAFYIRQEILQETHRRYLANCIRKSPLTISLPRAFRLTPLPPFPRPSQERRR